MLIRFLAAIAITIFLVFDAALFSVTVIDKARDKRNQIERAAIFILAHITLFFVAEWVITGTWGL